MIGSIAGILTTIAFLPQVLKVIRDRDAGAISLATCCLQVIGISLWVVHGITNSDMAILGANAVTICLVIALLICKLAFKEGKEKNNYCRN